MNWADKLEMLAKKGGQDLGKLCKAVKVEIFSGVVSDTRVATGRLRGNWQIQENAPTTSPIDRVDPTGSMVEAEIESKSTEEGRTYFVNNLPYAKTYEEKDAMVGRNVARVKRNINEQVKRLR